MATDQISVNDDSRITIQRGKHDKENPYFLVSRSMARDSSLSPKAKGALVFLLSLPDDWITHPRQLAKSLGIGKDQIYTILKELLRLGYAKRHEVREAKGKFNPVVYEFYEEKQVLPREIKENSTVSGNPDTGNPDTGIQTLRYTDHKKDIHEEERTSLMVPVREPDPEPERPADAGAAKAAKADLPLVSKPKKSKTPPEELFTDQVMEVANKMLDIAVESEPEFRKPKNITPLLVQVDLMLRVDKRDPEVIYRLVRWALSDYFYGPGLLNGNLGKKLREKWATLHKKMNSLPPEPKKERKFAPSSNDERSLEKFKEWSKGAI